MSVLDIVDVAEKIVVERWLRSPDTIQLTIDAKYANEIARGNFLYLPLLDFSTPLAFRITAIERDKAPGAHKLTVHGVTLDGLALGGRLCWPSPADYPSDTTSDGYDSQTSVPAETAIKHYVEANAGPSAVTDRQVPGFTVATDAARGDTVTKAARYQSVLDAVVEICFQTDLGWKTSYEAGTDSHVFEIIVPGDKSDEVFLDFEFQTITKWSEVETDAQGSLAVVAGQGQGQDRDIIIRPASEPAGLARLERFIDARDVAVGETAILEQRGDASLAVAGPTRGVTVVANQSGSFKYPTDYGLGDYVTARDRERDLSDVKQIIGVRFTVDRSASVPTIEPILDKADPTAPVATFSGGRQDQGGGGGSGTIDYAEDADISTQAFGDSPAAGASTSEVAGANHKHGMPSNPVTAHEAAGDPHTGYRLESADHSHASTGLQGGTVAHSVLTSVTADQHHNQLHQSAHNSGGGDALKLDDLAAPDDNTDLNASTTKHGLLKKLSNVSTEFMNGQGNWATPASGGAATVTVRTSGTANWTPAAASTAVRVLMWGGGGGGASGVANGNGAVRAGGGGGGGGSFIERSFRIADLTTPVSVAVGAGGGGGAAVGPTTTSGNSGTAGGDTTFGTYATAYGGGRGLGPNQAITSETGGSGAGTAGAGAIGATATTNTGGLPASTAGASGLSGQGAGSNSASAGGAAEYGGGAGGGHGTANGSNQNGGTSLLGGGGGGAGGNGGSAQAVGADGGNTGVYVTTGGGGGGGGAVRTNGTGGTSGAGKKGGTGGGGGGGSTSSTVAGGDGGAGGAYGGGGGGGGAVVSGGSATSGKGGDGGNGACIIIEW